MAETAIRDKVNSVIKEQGFEGQIEPEATLRLDLGFDSLTMVNLVFALEEKFGLELKMEDLNPARLLSVSDLYALIQKYVSE